MITYSEDTVTTMLRKSELFYIYRVIIFYNSLDVSFVNSLNKHHAVRPGMLLGGTERVLMYAGYSISTPTHPFKKEINIFRI